MSEQVEAEKVEALNVTFVLKETEGLIDLMNEYKGKLEPKYAVSLEDEVRLKNNLIKIVQKLKSKVTPEDDNPIMNHYLTQKDVDAYHAFAFRALCDENPILEPFWDRFGYTLYDYWQTDYLLFEDRKEEVDPKELEWE